MSTVLYALMLTVIVTAIVFGVLVGLGAWSLSRRNRLAPDLETGAPIQWLLSPSQPARLHRRLQRAVAPVHQPIKGRRGEPTPVDRAMGATLGPPSTVEDVCRAITGHAVAVDREVVQVARLPRRGRRPRLRLLEAEVAHIERLTVRVHHQRHEQGLPASIGGQPRSRSEALGHLDQHLDALADAHAELHAIERSQGLDDPERILRAIEGAPVPQPRPAAPTPRPAPSASPPPPRRATTPHRR